MSKRLIPGKLVTLSKFGESSRWLSDEHMEALENKVGLLYSIVESDWSNISLDKFPDYYMVLVPGGNKLGYKRKEIKLYKD
tara:strand:- start:241 stop:483 length:243 start_codon:yes stop_codon:yes gene_type:complete